MKDNRVLIACEYSGVVRDAFIKRGFDATSCDLLPTDAPGPHYQGDVRDIWGNGFDLIIAHPPCTDIAISGARWFPEKIADGRQQAGIDFFMQCVNAPAKFVAVENPICIMSKIYRKPDQIVQPWMFGESFQKSTCLWLKNLPKLKSTNVVDKGEFVTFESGRIMPKWYADCWGKDDAWSVRSQTFQGIADAMAKQWGDFILKPKGTMYYFGIQQKLF